MHMQALVVIALAAAPSTSGFVVTTPDLAVMASRLRGGSPGTSGLKMVGGNVKQKRGKGKERGIGNGR